MAYTVTSNGGSATLVGTSTADVLNTATITSGILVNSFEGDDELTLGAAVSSGTIGMGGDEDEVTTFAGTSNIRVTLGDAVDTYTAGAEDDAVTVGGQGGADTLNLLDASRSLYGGGQGQDTFTGSIGALTSVKGGSENDTIGEEGNLFFVDGSFSFVNGQVGDDEMDILVTLTSADVTIRGGSEADEISIFNLNTGTQVFGDDGADTIIATNALTTVSMEINGGGGADTISAGRAGGDISLGAGQDTVLIYDAEAIAFAGAAEVSDFNADDDGIAFAVGGTLVDGNSIFQGDGTEIDAGDDVVTQEIGGAQILENDANIFVWTGAATDNIETTLNNLGNPLIQGAIGNADNAVWQYTDTDGDVNFAILASDGGGANGITWLQLGTAAANIGDVTLTDDNYSFVDA